MAVEPGKTHKSAVQRNTIVLLARDDHVQVPAALAQMGNTLGARGWRRMLKLVGCKVIRVSSKRARAKEPKSRRPDAKAMKNHDILP